MTIDDHAKSEQFLVGIVICNRVVSTVAIGWLNQDLC